MNLIGRSEKKELYDYQAEAVEKLTADIEAGENPLLIMATGLGKTVVFSQIIANLLGASRKSLVLAHRQELIDQAVDKISAQAEYTPSKEKAEDRATRSAKVVVASVQTLQGQRLARWPQEHFHLLITDEAHHAPAPSYQKVYSHFLTHSHLGATATPDRADNKQLGKIFTKIGYEYSLPKAIKNKYLAPIIGKKVTDFDINLNDLKIVAGDFQEGELATVIEHYVAPIASSINKETSDRKTLVFMPNVESSRIMAETLKGLGLDAAYLSGQHSRDDRRRILMDFARGNISHLCSCNILLEGYDEPSIEAVVMLRPTGSRAVYSQAIGRGTRLHPGKENLLLVEFTYNSDRLKLVTPYELFSTEGFGEEVQRRAQKANDGTEIDYLAELEKAHDDMYRVSNILTRMVQPKTFGFTTFDPLDLGNLMGVDLTEEFDIHYEGRKLTGESTQKQRELLRRYGIADPSQLDKAQASHLIDTLFQSGHKPYNGEVTGRQAMFLKRRGFQPETMTKAQASILISKIKEAEANGDPVRLHSQLEETAPTYSF